MSGKKRVKKVTLQHFDEYTTKISNISLSNNCLLLVKKISYFDTVREVNTITGKVYATIFSKTKIRDVIQTRSIPLNETTPEELSIIRCTNTPTFVLKRNGKLYSASVPYALNLFPYKLLGNHKCSYQMHTCKRLSATSDEDGGCAKVREMSHCIERYPWILSGYESFNTIHDIFIVDNCEHYENHCF